MVGSRKNLSWVVRKRRVTLVFGGRELIGHLVPLVTLVGVNLNYNAL